MDLTKELFQENALNKEEAGKEIIPAEDTNANTTITIVNGNEGSKRDSILNAFDPFYLRSSSTNGNPSQQATTSQTAVYNKDQKLVQLEEELEEFVGEENDELRNLKENLKALKTRDIEISSELVAKLSHELVYKKLLEEHDETIDSMVSEYKKVKDEYATVQRHTANLQLAFTDISQKYERSIKIVDGYKRNEDALKERLVSRQVDISKSEEKYDLFKTSAMGKLEKANKDLSNMREKYGSELQKLGATVKRLEIESCSLSDSLKQKTKECAELAKLCEELTGKM